MGEALALVVPDPGAAIVVAILVVCAIVAFWIATQPVGEIVDPVESEFEPKPAEAPEDVARRVRL
jgi:hypothetical protein